MSRIVFSSFAGVLGGLFVGLIAVALAADDALGDHSGNADDGALWALRSSDGGLERLS